MGFKKAFDRVWHGELWATMKKYNIGRKFVHTIEQLYVCTNSSAVLVQSKIGEWFHTSVGVRQGCLSSPTVFSIFVERIMKDALEDHKWHSYTFGSLMTSTSKLDRNKDSSIC